MEILHLLMLGGIMPNSNFILVEDPTFLLKSIPQKQGPHRSIASLTSMLGTIRDPIYMRYHLFIIFTHQNLQSEVDHDCVHNEQFQQPLVAATIASITLALTLTSALNPSINVFSSSDAIAACASVVFAPP